jgi:hypothetical protein
VREIEPCTITIYPESDSDYVSEFYAGLFELKAMAAIDLRFGRCPPHRVRATDKQVIQWMDVAVASNRKVKVCFDTADWRNIASMDDIAAADVYFKRSYHAPFIGQLEQPLRDKVVPMGLHYGCSSRNESFSQSFRKVLAFNLGSGAFKRNTSRAVSRLFGNPTKRMLKRSGALEFANLPMFIDEFEATPEQFTEPKIYYRTRVYGPNDAPDNFRLGRMEEVNELRANTVRALRARFGGRFVGGLRSSEFARETYSDCMFGSDSGLHGHLELSKTCLINVNTAGLHDSTSWKIPEYMAASRCIVSEPMTYQIPTPLIEGKHYLGFSTPEECVAACETLLESPDRASAMRRDNFAYYTEHVRPDRLMSRCLQTVFERCVTTGGPEGESQ